VCGRAGARREREEGREGERARDRATKGKGSGGGRLERKKKIVIRECRHEKEKKNLAPHNHIVPVGLSLSFSRSF